MKQELPLQCKVLVALEASIAYAKQYARERKAFGKPIAELPLMKRNLNDYQTEVDALRALLVDTTSHYDIYQRLHLKKQHTGSLNESEQELYDDSWMWIRKRTPLVKFYATESIYPAINQSNPSSWRLWLHEGLPG